MKKIILLIVLAAGGFYFFSQREKPVLVVGVECDHAPYNWEEKFSTEDNFPLINNNGFYAEGYDVHIAKIVAEKIGRRVVFKKIHWDNLINALNRKEIDVIFSGMVDTEERKKIISFSIPYEVRKTEYAVLINRQSKYAKATSLKELEGAEIVAQKDSRFDEVIDQIPGVKHVKPLYTQEEVVKEVASFNVDGAVVNYDTGVTYTRKYDILSVIRFSQDDGFVLGFTGLCAGVRKNDTELLEKINDAIESISLRRRQKIMDKTISKVWSNL